MIDKTFEELISEVVEKTNGTQMTEEEYRYISSFLGNKNFLVFGCGHDSNLWRYANKNGCTIFLESNPDWIWDPKDTFLVNYNTTLGKSKSLLLEYKSKRYEKLYMDMPKDVLNTKWNSIFVDAPPGGSKKHPGRMQSIFMAKQLSSEGTNVFIHDCDRLVEDTWSFEIFGRAERQLTKLRHYKI